MFLKQKEICSAPVCGAETWVHEILHQEVKFFVEAKIVSKVQSNHLVVVFFQVLGGKVHHATAGFC